MLVLLLASAVAVEQTPAHPADGLDAVIAGDMLASAPPPPSCSSDRDCNQCEMCDVLSSICVLRPCGDRLFGGDCECPLISEKTLIAVGAVLLALAMLSIMMVLWHWTRSCRRPWDTELGHNARESLLLGADNMGFEISRTTDRTTACGTERGTLDSTVTCVVCMEKAINCVLMPCGHEVACLHCARRLGRHHGCPVCRTPVHNLIMLRAHAEVAQPLPTASLSESPSTARGSASTLQHSPPRRSGHGTRSSPGGYSASRSPLRDPSAVVMEEGAEDDDAGDEELGGGGAGADEDADGGCDDEVAASPQPAWYDDLHSTPPRAVRQPLMPISDDDAARERRKKHQVCLRCCAQHANLLLLPCCHKPWCADCAQPLPPTCPICEKKVTKGVRTYHKRL